MLLKLLGLPVTLPAAGIRYCLEKVAEVAEQQMYDDSVVKEELIRLQMLLEEGEIDEAEHRAREAPLLVRLREIKQRRRQQMEEELAESGGIVSTSAGAVVEVPEELTSANERGSLASLAGAPTPAPVRASPPASSRRAAEGRRKKSR